MTRRDYWLQTTDPNLLVFIPSDDSLEIMVIDTTDYDINEDTGEKVARWDNVPAANDFNLAVTLYDAAIAEARQALADFAPGGVELLTEHMAVTFARF